VKAFYIYNEPSLTNDRLHFRELHFT